MITFKDLQFNDNRYTKYTYIAFVPAAPHKHPDLKNKMEAELDPHCIRNAWS